MADGKTHLTIALVADIGFSLLSVNMMINGHHDVALGVATGAAIATIVTPD